MKAPKISIIGSNGAVGVSLNNKIAQEETLKDLISSPVSGLSQICPR